MSNDASFYNCRQCEHRTSAFKVLKAQGLWTEKGHPDLPLVESILGRLVCRECGAREPRITQRTSAVNRVEYVATRESDEAIFHRSNCSYMRRVRMDALIRFKDREEASKQERPYAKYFKMLVTHAKRYTSNRRDDEESSMKKDYYWSCGGCGDFTTVH